MKSVALLGDVGVGKSTIVEKVTGLTGLSSKSDQSFTRSSHAFQTATGDLQLIDTPGGNSMSERLQQNIWIAHALNLQPVNLILLCVKADTRIDTALAMLESYTERFIDFADLLGVCVTHMDLVTWKQDRFRQCLNERLGIELLMFSAIDTRGPDLRSSILKLCGPPVDITITSDNFLNYFQISDGNFKILRSCRSEVTRFQTIKACFMEQLTDPKWSNTEIIDLVFEFQAWMVQQVYAAQMRVSESNGFSFVYEDDATAANEAGHIANLTNQLRAVLYELRVLSFGYHCEAKTDFRKCPYCNEVWVKEGGCDETKCGNMVETVDARSNIMATFSFTFDGQQLLISKTGIRTLRSPNFLAVDRENAGAGCGRTIDWKTMAPVEVPAEFNLSARSIEKLLKNDSIRVLPPRMTPSIKYVFNTISERLGKIGKTVANPVVKAFGKSVASLMSRTPSSAPPPIRSETIQPPARQTPLPPGTHTLMELSMIHYSQESIMSTFQDGRLLTQTIRELRSGVTTLRDIPTITVFFYDDRYYSVNNRRLRVFKEVFQSEAVPVIIGHNDAHFNRKFTTKNRGVYVVVR